MKRFHVNVSVSDLAEGPAGLAWETVAAKTCCAGTG